MENKVSSKEDYIGLSFLSSGYDEMTFYTKEDMFEFKPLPGILF